MEARSNSKFLQKGLFSFPTRMMNCYKKPKKIKNIQSKFRKVEESRSKSATKINFSEKVSRAYPKASALKLAKTQSILKHSRFMPKTLKLSLMSIPDLITNTSPNSLRTSVLIKSPRSDSPPYYPSLVIPKIIKTLNSSSLPTDIQSRNKLLFNLRTEASNRFVPDPQEPPEEQDVVTRNQVWLLKKKWKIEQAKASFDNLIKVECPFKPILYKRIYPDFRTLTTKDSESSDPDSSPKKVKSVKKVRFENKTTKIIKPNSSLPSSPMQFITESENSEINPYSITPSISSSLSQKHRFSDDLIDPHKPLKQPVIHFKNT